MLYTFSQASYHHAELARYFAQLSADDALVLWQDGVLLPIKYPEYFQQLNAPCYAMEMDLNARGLTALIEPTQIQIISMQQLVQLTEQHAPQFAL